MITKININNVEFKNRELGQETVQWVKALSAQVRIYFLEEKFKKLDVVAPLIAHSYEGEGRGRGRTSLKPMGWQVWGRHCCDRK